MSRPDRDGDRIGPADVVVEPAPALQLDVEVNDAGAPSLAPELDPDRLRALAEFVVRAERQAGAWAVTVVLTDDRRLRELHRDFLGIDEETDVMTFPFGEDDATAGGEIVVSVERADEQGPAHGLAPAAEVAFLVVHGLLHLCGWEDGTAEERARMLDRQGELISAFERGDPEGGVRG